MAEAVKEKQNVGGDDKLITFAKIIDEIKTVNGSGVQPVDTTNIQSIEVPLKNIEKNTSVLPKLVTLLAKGGNKSPALSDSATKPSYYKKATTRVVLDHKRQESDRVVTLNAPQQVTPRKLKSSFATSKVSLPKPNGERVNAPLKPATRALNAVATSPVPEAIQNKIIKQSRAVKGAATPPPVVPVAEVAPPVATPQRDGKGRFQGSVAQQAQAEAKATRQAGDEKKTLAQSIKDGFKTVGGHAVGALKDGAQSVDTKEAAGQAAGGPLYSAGKELYGAAQDIKEKANDESTLIGKAWKGVKAKTGISAGSEPVTPVAAIPPSATPPPVVPVAEVAPPVATPQRDGKGRFQGSVAQTRVNGGKDKQASSIVSEIKTSENKEDKRHKELLAAVKSIGGTKTSQGMPRVTRTGPGSSKKQGAPKEKPSLKNAFRRGPDGKLNIRAPKAGNGGGGAGGGLLARGAGALMGGGGMLSGLAGMIGPAIAVAVAGVAGAAIGTGISNLLNMGAQKLTGDKNATAGGAAYDAIHGTGAGQGSGTKGGLRDVIGQVESGNKGYGAYQNKDSGVVSYGKYQFTADSGSLGTVLDKYSANGGKDADKAKQYSSIIKGGNKQQKEALRNDPQFKAMLDGASGEKAMQNAQEQTFDQNYFNPAMARGQKAGINVVKNQKVAGFLADTEVQAGSGGNQNVIGKAASKLQAQGLDFKTATEDQQMQALVSSRKEYTLSVADSKARKGDVKTAEMLRSTAADGGRIDQVANKMGNIDKSAGYEAAIAAKAGKAAETPTFAAAGTPEYAAMQAKFMADQQATPQSASSTGPGSSKKKGKRKVKSEPASAPKSGEATPTEEKKAETASPAAKEGEQTGVVQKASPTGPVTSEVVAQKSGSQAVTATKPDYAAKTQAMFDKADQQQAAPVVMSPAEQQASRDGIQKDYWVKEDARRAQSGEAFKQVKGQQEALTTEKDAKLSDVEKRRKEVDAKYDAGGLSDEEAGKQQVSLDAEAEQVKREHLSKMGDAISGGFKGVDAQSGELLAEKDAKSKALDAQIAGTPSQVAPAPALSKREQEAQKIAAEQQGKPTYQDKADAIEAKRVDAVSKINADTALSNEEKKQKKAEARTSATKEAQALKEEDVANNEKINARLDAADSTDTKAKNTAVTPTAEAVAVPVKDTEQAQQGKPAEGQAPSQTATSTVTEAAPAISISPASPAPVLDAVATQRSLSDAVNSGNQENASRIAGAKADKAAKDSKLQDITDREAAANSELEAKGASDADFNVTRDKFQAEREALKKPETAEAIATPAGSNATPEAQAKSAQAGNPQTAVPVTAVASSPPPVIPAPAPIQPPPPAPVTANVPEVSQLAAAMQNQQQAGGKQADSTSTVTQSSIKTEFDDTMLTLMAYDRI